MSMQKAGSQFEHRHRLIRRYRYASASFVPYGLLPALGLAIVFLVALIPFSHFQIQANAHTAAQEALVDVGADWAEVTTSGQWVTLKGQAPSNTAYRTAERAVREATKRTIFGIKARPITEFYNKATVISASTSASVGTPPVTQHNWTYTLDRSVLELSGNLPNEATRTTIVEAAELRRNPPRFTSVRDNFNITGRSVSDGYTETALRGVNALSRCDAGAASLTMGIFSLDCEAQTGTASEIEMLANAPLTYGKIGRIDVFDQADAEACDDVLIDLLSTTRIEFSSASAVIDAASAPLLDNVANAARTCPGTLRIEGHTDNSGRASLNERLSRQRAQAVRRALIQRGIAADRFIAEGFGATRPIADNATENGRARNRRIEIKVARNRQQ